MVSNDFTNDKNNENDTDKLNDKGTEKLNDNNKITTPVYEFSKFDATIWDRKFHDADELPEIEIEENESPFSVSTENLNKIIMPYFGMLGWDMLLLLI